MKDKTSKFITIAAFLIIAITLLALFAGPALLKSYILIGIGNCQKIPILCMKPAEEINNPEVNNAYASELLLYDFPKMSIRAPKGFDVVQELIKKSPHKKWKRKENASVIYVLYQPKGFFINLYPQEKKKGATDNYEFIRRAMYAEVNQVKNISDAFFVIMKSIFIPDLGDQKMAKMAKFTLGDRKGFLNYNSTGGVKYYDCNLFDKDGNFFAIYIKDKSALLDLGKVFTIISTAKAK